MIALVTGANRGLGLETARELARRSATVWLGARDAAKAAAAASRLFGDVRPVSLDVSDSEAIDEAFGRIKSETGLTVLVNNAGIDYDTDQDAATADLARVRRTFETNLFGAWTCAQAAAPILARHRHSVIVNVSSGSGALSSMENGPPGYATSKATLNALTRLLAASLRGQGTLVNAVCPGWVATDMGGGGRAVEEGAAGIVWAATLPPGGPSSGFFRDGRPIDW